jgi:uncharacterized protein YwgA
MNKLIAPFLKYLDEQKLIDFDIMCTEDFESDAILFDRNYDPENDPAFINQMNLQKYAYLAKRFGLDFPYQHSILLEGPFSSSLVDDFVHISKNRKELYDSITSNLPESFCIQKFLGFVKDKDALWLEIAASLIMWNEDGIETKDELIKFMMRVNPGLEQEYATKVLEELEPFGILKLKIVQ